MESKTSIYLKHENPDIQGEWHILATKKKVNSDVDIYVLMTGSFPTYEAKGWATAEDLFSEYNIVNLGHGEGYGLDQSKLSKFK